MCQDPCGPKGNLEGARELIKSYLSSSACDVSAPNTRGLTPTMHIIHSLLHRRFKSCQPKPPSSNFSKYLAEIVYWELPLQSGSGGTKTSSVYYPALENRQFKHTLLLEHILGSIAVVSRIKHFQQLQGLNISDNSSKKRLFFHVSGIYSSQALHLNYSSSLQFTQDEHLRTLDQERNYEQMHKIHTICGMLPLVW